MSLFQRFRLSITQASGHFQTRSLWPKSRASGASSPARRYLCMEVRVWIGNVYHWEDPQSNPSADLINLELHLLRLHAHNSPPNTPSSIFGVAVQMTV